MVIQKALPSQQADSACGGGPGFEATVTETSDCVSSLIDIMALLAKHRAASGVTMRYGIFSSRSRATQTWTVPVSGWMKSPKGPVMLNLRR